MSVFQNKFRSYNDIKHVFPPMNGVKYQLVTEMKKEQDIPRQFNGENLINGSWIMDSLFKYLHSKDFAGSNHKNLNILAIFQ